MDSTDHLEEPTKFALDFNVKFPSDVVKWERRKNLLQAKLMAAGLAEDEKKLHSALPPSLQKVLEVKSLLVRKALLEKYHYDDMGVTAFMFEGASAEGLEASSVWRRKAIVGRLAASDPAHVEHLEETAREELGMGFLEGCFESEAAVTAHLGWDDWCVVRRFVLVEGAEMKLRPIDDCLEAQLNYAYTVTAYLKLQDVDYITGLALRIAEVLNARNLGPGINGKPKYFVANSLMFGSCAAVYSFNRGLWFLLNRMLVVPCGVFYDGFPMFSWRHAKTGTKACPFQSKFRVLGCALDLSELVQGAVVLENKPGRIDRLVTLLKQIQEDKVLTKHQGQVIHGLMRHACGFFSGKFLHQVCADVLALSGTQAKKGPADISSFCQYAIAMLQQAAPKRIEVGFEKRPILIFTDGCWEDGFAG
eukprot:s291_g32.t1